MAHDLQRRFGCPVELSMEVLGGKWKTVLLARLKDGPLRYAELRALVPGLSDKVLTQRLRDMEELGLVEVTRRAGTSTYRTTARAERLRPALDALYACGVALAPEVGASVE
ncbi:winged helix-turn-helix transcriptional regulator [Sandaracinus amylolyticus]|uniref:Transcriptional regulator, HxlR family protein n=1 Tax=Sandaracinus amylolyticus TaxID=927083 RepID=A0A0F6SG16_9BACT|nr:helix-turn-helix domain-containing protein [Sandaracinus amylolyticus]AKF07909.1 Transcriptional regulator, HxlR family protein [Sandaracinus amylolyticus]